MTDDRDDDRDDGRQAAWANEYAAYCAEQDDEDEINRLLSEAANADE